MVPDAAVQKFRVSLRGRSFVSGEPGYDAARTLPTKAMPWRAPRTDPTTTGWLP